MHRSVRKRFGKRQLMKMFALFCCSRSFTRQVRRVAAGFACSLSQIASGRVAFINVVLSCGKAKLWEKQGDERNFSQFLSKLVLFFSKWQIRATPQCSDYQITLNSWKRHNCRWYECREHYHKCQVTLYTNITIKILSHQMRGTNSKWGPKHHCPPIWSLRYTQGCPWDIFICPIPWDSRYMIITSIWMTIQLKLLHLWKFRFSIY